MEKSARTLGGLGCILILCSLVFGLKIPGFNAIVSLAGFALIILAFFRASEEFDNPDIKALAVKAAISIAIATSFALLGLAVKSSLFASILRIAAYLLMVLASYLIYRANLYLAVYTKERLFKIGGLVQLIGYASQFTLLLSILSLLLVLIGYTVLLVAFFVAKERDTSS